MFCKKCGKEIPDESIYCMYCGSLLKKASSNESINTAPPVYIDHADIWVDGPTEVRKGKNFFANDIVGRWVGFKLCLMDDCAQYTASNGTVIISIAKGIKVEKTDPNILGILKKESSFYYEFEAKIQDFRWRDYSSIMGRNWSEFNLSFLYNSNLVFAEKTTHPFYMFFRTETNNLLVYSGNRWEVDWRKG